MKEGMLNDQICFEDYEVELSEWSKHHKVVGLLVKRVYEDGETILSESEKLKSLIEEHKEKLKAKLVQTFRWHKQRLKVAKLHEKIANQRKDFLHKESHKLSKRYDCVVIEDLNMKGMSQALHFGQSVHDNGWGMFTTFLQYKLEEQGKKLIKIDKWFSSSKTCSCCGQVKESLSLSERTFRCECGFESDRDVNAAINIKHEGMKRLAIA